MPPDPTLNQLFARPPDPKQCETRSPSGQCPDAAFYAVDRIDLPIKFYCVRCISAVLFYGTNKNKTVHVSRV